MTQKIDDIVDDLGDDGANESELFSGFKFAKQAMRDAHYCIIVLRPDLKDFFIERHIANVVLPNNDFVTEHASLIAEYVKEVILVTSSIGDLSYIPFLYKLLPLNLRVKILECPPIDIKKEDIKPCSQDAIHFYAKASFQGTEDDAFARGHATERLARLLTTLPNTSLRTSYIDSVSKVVKVKPADLKKNVQDIIKDDAEEIIKKNSVGTDYPVWINPVELMRNGFVQNSEFKQDYNPGIYFRDNLERPVTNFTIAPLYHIYGNNNRRIIKINNGFIERIVEMPSRAMVSQDAFETVLVEKGSFLTNEGFTKRHFKMIIAAISSKMPLTYELLSLGWQNEVFFAFNNKIFKDKSEIDFDEVGIAEVGDKYWLSPSVSKMNVDDRNSAGQYENDAYLTFIKSKIDFKDWAKLYFDTYGENAMMGIAFVFISLFKDIVLNTTKCPLLYCYGPKGSGKSDFAESLTWLFFSGKNAKGQLIQGYNLNPGQGTPFSFFNRRERFMNCPMLWNEFDENNIEDWKFGAFKSGYDGEGREVGDGETGKKRKTKIQETNCTDIIVGQYLSVKDSGSVLSRALTCSFSLERIKSLSESVQESHHKLKQHEEEGLSSIICELLFFRNGFKEKMQTDFWTVHHELKTEMRAAGYRIEERLLKNYTLAITMIKIAVGYLTLPFKLEDFSKRCKSQMINHSLMLKQNDILSQFWRGIEIIYDQPTPGLSLIEKTHFDIQLKKEVKIKVDGKIEVHEFKDVEKVIFIRLNLLQSVYSKFHKDRTGKQAPEEDTLLIYMKDQPYFIGLCTAHQFNDKSTSCYVLKYEDLEIGLEKNLFTPEKDVNPVKQNTEPKQGSLNVEENGDNLPF